MRILFSFIIIAVADKDLSWPAVAALAVGASLYAFLEHLKGLRLAEQTADIALASGRIKQIEAALPQLGEQIKSVETEVKKLTLKGVFGK